MKFKPVHQSKIYNSNQKQRIFKSGVLTLKHIIQITKEHKKLSVLDFARI